VIKELSCSLYGNPERALRALLENAFHISDHESKLFVKQGLAEMTEDENQQLLDMLCAPPFARVPFLRGKTLDDDTIIVVAKQNNIFAIYDDVEEGFGIIIYHDNGEESYFLYGNPEWALRALLKYSGCAPNADVADAVGTAIPSYDKNATKWNSHG
jgi:hypothetical protein